MAVYYQDFHDAPPGHLRKILKKRGIRLVVSHAYRGQVMAIRRFDLAFFGGAPLDPNDQDKNTLRQIAQIKIALKEGIPLFGICRGLQLLALAAEGEVGRAPVAEYGMYDPQGAPYMVELTPEGLQDPLLSGLGKQAFRVFQMHKLMVRPESVPGATLLGTGKHCPVQLLKIGPYAYGIQSHVEFALWMMHYFMTKVHDFYGSLPPDTLQKFMDFYDEYLALTTLLINNFVDIALQRRRQRQT